MNTRIPGTIRASDLDGEADAPITPIPVSVTIDDENDDPLTDENDDPITA